MTTYKIIRFFRDHDEKWMIKGGLSLDQAQAWCTDKETSSETAVSPAARKLTEDMGPWFDGWSEHITP